jgi:hypothetical protein
MNKSRLLAPLFSLRTSRVAGLAGAVVLAAGLAGCSTVPLDREGAMQATYVAGSFRMVVNADAPRTASATTKAFEQLGLFAVKKEMKPFAAELAARTPKDEKIRVSIKEINSKQTELAIRVDVAGDKTFSRKLYERIEANLGGAGVRSGNGW